MRNIRSLVVSCLLVVACGQVTTVDPGDGGNDRAGSGGSSGSGGTSGTGGSSGSGGASGSGGTSGSGGSSGSGGASGSGGSPGTGGAVGSGGAGSGGVSGSGGTVTDASDGPAPDAGDPCHNLIVAYDVALIEAKHCNPLLSILQCQTTVSTTLNCPGCTTHVQDATKLNAIRAKWTETGCKSGLCPAIACVAPGNGLCKATPDRMDTQGLCVDDRGATTQ